MNNEVFQKPQGQPPGLHASWAAVQGADTAAADQHGWLRCRTARRRDMSTLSSRHRGHTLSGAVAPRMFSTLALSETFQYCRVCLSRRRTLAQQEAHTSLSPTCRAQLAWVNLGIKLYLAGRLREGVPDAGSPSVLVPGSFNLQHQQQGEVTAAEVWARPRQAASQSAVQPLGYSGCWGKVHA